ncbi:MFS transporter [Corynebacterium sp. sy039]|uniref:MFS transporter n=1 Tax=Corynebacterium sp. sy039 TaxID=2599641 RepID=UPI0011B7E26F|nr:MFS transporter [Corynebacterium sp. sy039]QDZ43183.1 MFS transporter [Corynebacterium sp. sy039]
MGNKEKLYRDKNFVAYFSASIVSSFGSSLVDSVWPVIAYWLTDSPLITGLTVLAQVAPQLLFGLVAGAQVDRARSKRNFLLIPNIISALAYALAAALGAHSLTALALALICYTISETADLYFSTALMATLPSLFGRKNIAQVRSTISIVISVLGFISPVLAVFILNKTNERILFLCNSVSFVVAFFLLLRITTLRKETTPPLHTDSATTSQEKPSLWADITSGFTYLWQNAPVRVLTLVGILNAFVGGVVAALYLPLADNNYGIGNHDPRITYLLYAMLIGGIVGSFLLPRLREREISPILVGASSLLINTLTLLLMVFSQSFLLLFVSLLFWQASYGLVIMNAIVLRMEVVAEEYLGRVSATARLISWGASPVGALAAGFLAQINLATPHTILLCSALLPVIGAGCLLVFHKNYRLRIPDAPSSDSASEQSA